MKVFAVLNAAIALIAADPASAATFAFSIDSGYGAGSGTWETAGNGDTATPITALMGTFAGDTISLLPVGVYPSSFTNDNLFINSVPYFDNRGLSFSAGGYSYNLYYEGRGSMPSLQFCGQTTGCEITTLNNFSVVQSAVPEPAGWAMMLFGFGMTSVAMRYRRRTTKTANA